MDGGLFDNATAFRINGVATSEVSSAMFRLPWSSYEHASRCWSEMSRQYGSNNHRRRGSEVIVTMRNMRVRVLIGVSNVDRSSRDVERAK
jgi:hypothetical protein